MATIKFNKDSFYTRNLLIINQDLNFPACYFCLFANIRFFIANEGLRPTLESNTLKQNYISISIELYHKIAKVDI